MNIGSDLIADKTALKLTRMFVALLEESCVLPFHWLNCDESTILELFGEAAGIENSWQNTQKLI